MTDMASQFVNFYVGNLSTLSKEIQLNQHLIQLVVERKKTVTSDLQQKFKQLVMDMIKKRKLNHADVADRDFQIKKIYFQVRQIRTLEDYKQTLTRESCDILDKYFASLGREVESIESNPVNADGQDDELAKTLASIKLHLDKPVEGDAVVVDVIKKMEKRDRDSEQRDQEDHGSDFDGSNGNSDLFSTEFKKITLEEMLEQRTKNIASDMTPQMDNLQTFIDKVVSICSEMKDRYGTGEASNSVSEEAASTEEEEYDLDALCHCRSPEYGQMVECDDANCKIKWYHFDCVGLTKSPEGLWFCPSCIIFGDEPI
ncbi:PHD finger protein ING1-like [Bradysia coprophila]|uniref:PHD finger protein ING1-like n=1 Tax=Bradysia coprophila TaxID=38358 RepID=UPI00187D875A|nr:PHD finger protein ING1-like [Bradysia coprophila]